MPRYYFNIHDGISLPDPQGKELASMRDAQLEALRLAGDIIAEDAGYIANGDDWRLEITDHAGSMLFRIGFMAGKSADARRSSP